MPDINKPMDIPELNLQPPISGKVKLSEDMQQTLALLCAYVNNKRVTLKASETGMLLVAEPLIQDVVFVQSAAGTGLGQGDNLPCSSVIVMAHPNNSGRAWVRPYKVSDATHGWPLDAGDVVSFSVNNVNQIYLYTETPEQRIIVAYTR